MDLNAECVTLEVLGPEKTPVWQRDILLPRHGTAEGKCTAIQFNFIIWGLYFILFIEVKCKHQNSGK